MNTIGTESNGYIWKQDGYLSSPCIRRNSSISHPRLSYLSCMIAEHELEDETSSKCNTGSYVADQLPSRVMGDRHLGARWWRVLSQMWKSGLVQDRSPCRRRNVCRGILLRSVPTDSTLASKPMQCIHISPPLLSQISCAHHQMYIYLNVVWRLGCFSRKKHSWRHVSSHEALQMFVDASRFYSAT